MPRTSGAGEPISDRRRQQSSRKPAGAWADAVSGQTVTGLWPASDENWLASAAGWRRWRAKFSRLRSESGRISIEIGSEAESGQTPAEFLPQSAGIAAPMAVSLAAVFDQNPMTTTNSVDERWRSDCGSGGAHGIGAQHIRTIYIYPKQSLWHVVSTSNSNHNQTEIQPQSGQNPTVNLLDLKSDPTEVGCQ